MPRVLFFGPFYPIVSSPLFLFYSLSPWKPFTVLFIFPLIVWWSSSFLRRQTQRFQNYVVAQAPGCQFGGLDVTAPFGGTGVGGVGVMEVEGGAEWRRLAFSLFCQELWASTETHQENEGQRKEMRRENPFFVFYKTKIFICHFWSPLHCKAFSNKAMGARMWNMREKVMVCVCVCVCVRGVLADVQQTRRWSVHFAAGNSGPIQKALPLACGT